MFIEYWNIFAEQTEVQKHPHIDKNKDWGIIPVAFITKSSTSDHSLFNNTKSTNLIIMVYNILWHKNNYFTEDYINYLKIFWLFRHQELEMLNHFKRTKSFWNLFYDINKSCSWYEVKYDILYDKKPRLASDWGHE